MIDAALIGISGYGRTHLRMARAQAQAGRLRLVAAVVINQADEQEECLRLQREGCRIFAATDEMWSVLAGAVDLCFIPTAIHRHSEMTLTALAAGANVLVEKPLAGSLAEADLMIAAGRKAGRFIAVGFQDIYSGVCQSLKRRLVGGEWGKIRNIRIAAGWPRANSYYRRNEWAGRVRLGEASVLDSPVSNALAHFFNLALYLAGETQDGVATFVALDCDLWRARCIESYDTCSVRLRLAGGALLTGHFTHSCREEVAPRVELGCERGRIVWEHEKELRIFTPSGPAERIALETLEAARMLVGQATVSRVLGEATPIFDAEAAREHVRVFTAMQEAAVVEDIPADHVEMSGPPDDPIPAIRNIEAALERAVAGQCLFSESGVAWARRVTAPAKLGPSPVR